MPANGNVNIGDGNCSLTWRKADNGNVTGGLESGIYFSTPGRESVVFANMYAHTGWIFVNGIRPSNKTNWNALGVTPAVQIHHNALYINRAVRDSDISDYNLYVNGTSNLHGNNFLYGDLSAFYDNTDQYLQYTAEGTVASHAAKISLYRIIASGKAGAAGTKVPGVQLDAATGMLHLQAAASDPSASAGARIKFTYWNAADSNGQPVYISHSVNDTYRAPYGLKIWGSDGSAPGAWLEVEGNLYIGSASNSNSNNNAALYIRGMSAIEGYDTWLRLNDNSSFSSGTLSPKLIRSDEALQVGSGGANFYANTTRTYVQTHLGVGATNDNHTFYVSGTSYLQGRVYLPHNTWSIQFRPNSNDTSDCSYNTGTYYGTAGNEALAFVTRQSVTSFMFVTGSDPNVWTSSTWQSTSPTLQIKNKSVYVNSLIANGTNPSYNFYVNGTSYFNGAATINSALTTNGLIYQTSNSNTLTLGAQNTAYCHIESSTLNFYFNKTIEVDGNVLPYTNNSFDLGSTGKYWRNIYGITFHGTLDGNAATTTKFASAQSITLTGDTTGTASSQAGWSIGTTTSKLSKVEHIDTVEKLDGFIEANKLKYATVAGVGGVASDGMIISVPWSSSDWGHQIFLDDSAMVMQHRHRYTKTNSDGSKVQAWSGWATILDTVNYTGALDGHYVKKSGDTMTGMLRVNNAPIFGYRYGQSNNAPAFIFDKPGSYYTGIGTNGSDDTIYFGAVSADNNWNWVTSYQQKWVFNGDITADKVYGAVWNDYAEYRSTSTVNPGQCVVETGLGDLVQSTKRLQPGANIVSDTFGFAIGETEQTKTPLAVSGRVLAYPYEDRYSYSAGDPVCSGPNGTISKMTRKEVREYPDRIVGTVSEIPEYETWGTGNVKVNGRIWIKVK